MKKAILMMVGLIFGLMVLATSAAMAGGDQNRGEVGEGSVIRDSQSGCAEDWEACKYNPEP